jgi:4-amino-4-deoxy-L-arabinose transferase-like glycosyltransferase
VSAPRRDLLLVFLGALALRLLILATTADDPVFTTPMLDAEYAVDWARAIRAGDVFGSPEGTAYFRTPLYAWFLALAFLLPGPDLLAARILQSVLGALACALLADVAGRRFGRSAAIATGILGATAWPLLVYGRELLIESIVPFLGAALLSLLDGGRGEGRTGRWLAIGLVLALATLARPNFLLLAVPAALAAAASAAGGRRLGALLAGLLLLLVPVAMRNRLASGEWIALSYQGGINLWIGNNPEADGMSARLPGFTSWRNEDVDAALAREYGRPLGAAEQDAHFRRLAREFLVSRPREALGLLARKTYLLLQGYEIRNDADLYELRRRDPVLRLPLPDFGWILPLALLGALVQRRRWREWSPLAGYALAAGLGVVLFFVCARYRLILWPALLPLAGAGAASLAEHGAGRGRLAARAAVLALLVALAAMDPLGIRQPGQALTHHGYGNVYTRVGDRSAAEREFRAALRLDPDLGEASYHLGALLLLEGRGDEALPELRRAAAAMPRSFRVRRTLAEALEARGDLAAALSVRREACDLSAGRAEDRLALANTLGMNRRYEEAWRLYEPLLAESAADPLLWLHAGNTALALGREDVGLALLAQAAEVAATREAARRAAADYFRARDAGRGAAPVPR